MRRGHPNSQIHRSVDESLGRYKSHGVATNVAWTERGRQGAYYIEQAGEPRGTNVIYDRTDAAIRTATPSELTDGVDLAATDAWYTSGITLALSAQLRETTATLLKQAQRAGATTAFDLNYRSKLWSPDTARSTCVPLLEWVDIVVIAARDARLVLEQSGSDEAILQKLAAVYEPEVVVLTQGSDGAIAIDDNSMIHDQPTFSSDTRDPIGTGDAFVGGFLTEYLEGGSVPSALEYGAATAALKRTITGDLAIVTPAAVDDVIDNTVDGIDR